MSVIYTLTHPQIISIFSFCLASQRTWNCSLNTAFLGSGDTMAHCFVLFFLNKLDLQFTSPLLIELWTMDSNALARERTAQKMLRDMKDWYPTIILISYYSGAPEANTEHGIADPRPQARVSPHSIYKNAEFWAWRWTSCPLYASAYFLSCISWVILVISTSGCTML